ncbi:MAG: EutN/CcmL family microcompartment protein [Defluviitaleaceae bacterium]|nr:EutN/CcmL family microcompartment protein [Defluviitaleaceae bacterium]
MIIGLVVGSVVSTQKDESLVGYKLLVVQQLNIKGEVVSNKDMVAVDFAGAGVGDKVLLSSGSSARQSARKEKAPIDLAIVGIIDTMENNYSV